MQDTAHAAEAPTAHQGGPLRPRTGSASLEGPLRPRTGSASLEGAPHAHACSRTRAFNAPDNGGAAPSCA
jgi:hypothetical protein